MRFSPRSRVGTVLLDVPGFRRARARPSSAPCSTALISVGLVSAFPAGRISGHVPVTRAAVLAGIALHRQHCTCVAGGLHFYAPAYTCRISGCRCIASAIVLRLEPSGLIILDLLGTLDLSVKPILWSQPSSPWGSSLSRLRICAALAEALSSRPKDTASRTRYPSREATSRSPSIAPPQCPHRRGSRGLPARRPVLDIFFPTSR